MPNPYEVYVTRDDRLEHRNYDMGLTPLFNDDEVTVTFLPERDYYGLKPDDLRGANSVVLLKDEISASSLEGLDDLRHVARFGAGFDSVDIAACTDRDIIVTNAPQGMRKPVAQATLGMLLLCASHMKTYDTLVRTSGFAERLENMGVELFSKTVGVIGMGSIGSKLVELLEPFDVDLLVYDPYMSAERATELGVERVDLDPLLEAADFVSLHCPLTEETQGLLDEAEFRSMKSTAYFVNTTRGGIYSDEVLATAVEEGWIAGAAIDVFENEPDVEGNPLLELDEVLVMPHAAGINKDGLTRVGEIVSEAVKAVKAGGVPDNVLNPGVSKTIPDEKVSPSYQ